MNFDGDLRQLLYLKEEIAIKNIFNNFDENTLSKAKNKLDAILSDKQKKEIYDKIKGMDKDELLKMLNNIDLKGVNGEKLDSLMNNLDTESIINKLNDLK